MLSILALGATVLYVGKFALQGYSVESYFDLNREIRANEIQEVEHLVDLSVREKIYSKNAILLKMSNGEVLFSKAENELIYPASLTKIMTALVALENTVDLESEVTLEEKIFDDSELLDASVAGFKADERVKIIDLLYGLMLPSGAECSKALAIECAGSEWAFVDLMNQKAAELGLKNTHFENATGLHSESHYTTVKDLSILLSEALKNETFRELFSTSKHFVESTNKHPKGIMFKSTMFNELEKYKTNGYSILGGKTGYTSIAGLCLASYISINEEDFLLITAGANGNHNTEPYHIIDAITIYDSLVKGLRNE